MELYGTLATDCGFTPDQIGAMLLTDANRIFEHWKRFPPVRRLVAAAIGFKVPEPVDKTKHLTLEEFQAMLGAGMGKGSNLLR